ncbi:AB hydrolase-1 domain-containing protein [Mycena kentingensis (nom. inval.)]|nr:AB hydrolase-1 domain-containing protein [Mycena kentingensis (nom. inval.)]
MATFLLVPGVLHTPAHFQPLIDALNARGCPAQSVALPTVGAFAESAALNADAVAVKSALQQLVVAEKKNVVLVCHSYGGIPGCQAVAGFEKAARVKEELEGGVVRIIFLSAILPKEGESLLDAFAGAGVSPGDWLEPSSASTLAANSKASERLYHELDTKSAADWTSKLEPMSIHILSTPAVDTCWSTDLPRTYILCLRDQVFSFEEQGRFLERIRGEGDAMWSTKKMDCGHSPMLSHVEELTEILTREQEYKISSD